MDKIKRITLGFFIGILLFFAIPYFSYGTIAVFGYDELSGLLPNGTIVFYFIFLYLIFFVVGLLAGKPLKSALIASSLLFFGVLIALIIFLFFVFGSFGGSSFI